MREAVSVKGAGGEGAATVDSLPRHYRGEACDGKTVAYTPILLLMDLRHALEVVRWSYMHFKINSLPHLSTFNLHPFDGQDYCSVSCRCSLFRSAGASQQTAKYAMPQSALGHAHLLQLQQLEYRTHDADAAADDGQ
jgi:hypothetical protein